jgi:hypothetical protein
VGDRCTVLLDIVQSKDAEKAKRIMTAMLKMKKIDINRLRRAFEGR